MPIGIVGVGGLVLGKVVKDMMEADQNTEKADRLSVKAAEQQYAAEMEERSIKKSFNDSVTKLANRKRAVLKASFPRFENVYKQIMQIQFNNDTRGIKELFSPQKFQAQSSAMNGIMAIEPLQLTDKQLVSAFLVSGATSILLGSLNPISFLALGAADSIKKDSELAVTTARAQKKQAQVYAEAVAAQKDALEALCWHLEQVSDVLAKLNALFLKSIKTSAEVIERNGYSSLNYSEEDLMYIGTCMNMAKAVKTIIDSPILDEDNRLVEAAKEIIVTGQTFVEQFSQLV